MKENPEPKVENYRLNAEQLRIYGSQISQHREKLRCKADQLNFSAGGNAGEQLVISAALKLKMEKGYFRTKQQQRENNRLDLFEEVAVASKRITKN